MYVLYFIYTMCFLSTLYCLNFIKNKYDTHYKILKKFDKNVTLFSVIKMCISTCFSFLQLFIKLKLQNYINGFCITKISKNTYQVELVIQKKLIKFKVKIYNGPSKCLQIIDNDTNNDITTILEPYFTHEIVPSTIKDYQLNKVDLYLSNGDVIYFEEDDTLKLN